MLVGWKLTAFKGGFFDRDKVIAAMDRATLRALSRFGAFVRTRAQSSIRPRKKISKPGSPPTNRTGLLKKFILFAYDAARRSVVIGPTKLNQKRGEAPALLEYGGETRAAYSREVILQPGDPIPGRARGIRHLKRGKTRYFIKRGDRLRYEARPYMGPAEREERPKLPGLWRNSLKAA